MQQLISRIKWPWSGGRTAALDENTRRRADVRWGIAGLVAVVLVFTAFGIVYITNVGVRTYTAELTDAAAVRVGDEVRVAGITVGKVTDLSLRADHVDMTFTVEDGIFVGDQTTVDVRMLTIVGGHYLALTPAGTAPLDGTVIPADRVILPYSLPRIFDDALQPIQEVDGEILRQNFAALQESIRRTPESLGTALTAVNSIVDILNRQSEDVSKTLAIADEYLASFLAAKDVVKRLVDKFILLETIAENYKYEVNAALELLAQTLARLAPVGRQWDSTLKPMAQPLADAIPRLDEIGGKFSVLADSLHEFGQRLIGLVTPAGTVDIDQSGTTIDAPALCIPTPGRTC